MIKKSKNNENKPDFDDMMSEVQERMPNKTSSVVFLNSNN